MFDVLINFWQQTYATYLEGTLHKVMYYYLTLCIGVVGVIYFWLYWNGALGFAILFSVWAGAPLNTTQPPITIVQAIGMILIVRYTLLGGIDAVAKRVPSNIQERLAIIEDKLNDMHELAFTGFLNSRRIKEVRKELKERKNDG